MKVVFWSAMKLLPLLLLAVFACTDSPSLTEKERSLVGSWTKPTHNGPMVGWYMEFQEDRTGSFGPAFDTDGSIKLNKLMSFVIKDWQIQNDTLVIQFKSQPGLAFYGPDGKEIKPKEGPSVARYVVWEVSDNFIVLEDLVAEFSGVRDRFERSERIEVSDK